MTVRMATYLIERGSREFTSDKANEIGICPSVGCRPQLSPLACSAQQSLPVDPQRARQPLLIPQAPAGAIGFSLSAWSAVSWETRPTDRDDEVRSLISSIRADRHVVGCAIWDRIVVALPVQQELN